MREDFMRIDKLLAKDEADFTAADTEDYAIYSPDYLSLAAKAIDAHCRELQPLPNFPLLRTMCVPEAPAENGGESQKMPTNTVVGRLGLEPRTNTLKGYCSTN
jgi:hypothetical protein